MSEPGGPVQVQALAVRAPVGQDGGHATQQIALYRRAVEAVDPGDPTHRRYPRGRSGFIATAMIPCGVRPTV